MLLLPCAGKKPRIHRSAWIAPNATIIGDVEIGPDSSVFYGSVLRGDVGAIRIGASCNIQDNCVFHVEEDTPCVLEDDVTVGHMAMVHAAHVEAGCLVGNVLFAALALHYWHRLAHRGGRRGVGRNHYSTAQPCRRRAGQGAP